MALPVIREFGSKEAALFGRHTLQLQHRLHEHPLFTDEGLAELIERIPRGKYNLHAMSAPDEPRAFWKQGELGNVSGAEVIRQIREGRLWLNLRTVNAFEPRYAELLESIFDTFESNVPGLKTFRRSFGILISSPGAQVFYHVDEPGQALWQVRGRKRIWLYPNTPPFLMQKDMEGIILGETEEEIPYQPWFDEFAEVFDLEAGDGLVWPLNAPHRVINEDVLNVSVTTSHWTDDIRRSRVVHFANGILRRKLGIQQPVYAIRGYGVLLKAAFGLACRYAGMHKAKQCKKQISFLLDEEGLTTSSPELSQPCAVAAGM